jgi:hypothetical protein
MLTGTTAEANRQVRELSVITLMQALQSGDQDRIDELTGELAIEDAPGGRCKTFRDAVEAVRSAQGQVKAAGEALPIYVEAISQRDSADLTVVELQLLVAPKARDQVRTAARLTYDNGGGKWRASKDLVKGLCAAGGNGK